MISSRDVKELHPAVQAKVSVFKSRCAAEGVEVLIYCTYRDREAQDALYAIGRTKPGAKVTNARGGESFHQYRCAFDFVPLLHGKPQWNDKALYAKCGGIAEEVGLEWSGRWAGKLKETAHCQYTAGLTLADFQAGKTIGSSFGREGG